MAGGALKEAPTPARPASVEQGLALFHRTNKGIYHQILLTPGSLFYLRP